MAAEGVAVAADLLPGVAGGPVLAGAIGGGGLLGNFFVEVEPLKELLAGKERVEAAVLFARLAEPGRLAERRRVRVMGRPAA